MREFRDLTHSPHHLLVFETAARCGSFTRAAKELNVSQPAVSLAVRQLEAALGFALFERGHRTIALTEAGAILYHDVSAGFTRILETIKLLRRKQLHTHVTLSASTAFANYWMVPRLADFRAKHPDIDLRLQTTDKDLDLAEEGISLGVQRGHGTWPGYASAEIAPEILYPIASPLFLREAGPFDEVAQLTDKRLIHLEEPYRPRQIWKDWFDAMDVEYRDLGQGLRLNDYALVLQAAMAGEGIALGWNHVVERLIAQELLAPVGPWTWETGAGFHLIWSEKAELSEPARAVRDWILDAAETSRHDPKRAIA